MKLLSFFFLFLIAFVACIDPLAVKLPNVELHLVVDGLITDSPGPYQVELKYSSDLDESVIHSTPETGALVWISDDHNQTELLTEITPGVYQTQTAGIRGEVGRTYGLTIKTKNGKEYIAQPQKLLPSGIIDSVYFEYESQALVPADDNQNGDAFNIYIDARGVSGESNLFRWRSTGIYETKSFPESKQELIPMSRPPTYIPAPEPCSGYINDGNVLRRVDECTCCVCWSSETSRSALVSDSRFVNNTTYNKVSVTKVPITKILFHTKYYLEVEQLSLSEDAYNFWKLVESQQKSNGSLFQPNSVKVNGNLKSITNPEEEVFGVFAVSASTKKSIFIYREDVPYALPTIDSVAQDCRISYPYSSNDKPPFW